MHVRAELHTDVQRLKRDQEMTFRAVMNAQDVQEVSGTAVRHPQPVTPFVPL